MLLKSALVIGLASLLGSSLALAAQPLQYPEKKPLLTFEVPDEWEAEFLEKDHLFVAPPGDEDTTIVEVTPLTSELGDLEGALEEALETIAEFKDIKIEEGQGAESEEQKLNVFNVKGKDEHGPAFINFVVVGHKTAKKQILVSIISTHEGFAKEAEAIKGVLSTLTTVQAGPAKAAMNEEAEAAVQTFSYPSKEAPIFAMDFPADWVMQAEAESAYIVSPDKLVAMNVLLIDQGELPVALEALKKQTGDKFDSIEWAEPQEMKDEALGLTATFHNGTALDGETKISVNLAEYVRKGGDKFLVFICQHPLQALEVHGNAIQQTVQSIKVK